MHASLKSFQVAHGSANSIHPPHSLLRRACFALLDSARLIQYCRRHTGAAGRQTPSGWRTRGRQRAALNGAGEQGGQQRPFLTRSNTGRDGNTVDLHAFFVKEALERARAAIQAGQEPGMHACNPAFPLATASIGMHVL